jgi:hypothetical protein
MPAPHVGSGLDFGVLKAQAKPPWVGGLQTLALARPHRHRLAFLRNPLASRDEFDRFAVTWCRVAGTYSSIVTVTGTGDSALYNVRTP